MEETNIPREGLGAKEEGPVPITAQEVLWKMMHEVLNTLYYLFVIKMNRMINVFQSKNKMMIMSYY